MKKFLKILLISAIIAVVIVIIILFLVSAIIGGGGLFNPPINQKKAEKIFFDDHDTIIAVVDYIKNSKYDGICIQNTDYLNDDGEYGTWYIYDEHQDTGTQKINDKDVVDMLDVLFTQKNYLNISKDKNTISFLLWSNLDAGRGIAYTLDGNPPTLQFLTKYEKLDEENWYYYEEDFNEWRRRNNEKNSY